VFHIVVSKPPGPGGRTASAAATERASFLICCDVVPQTEFLDTELSTSAVEKARLLLQMSLSSLIGEKCIPKKEHTRPDSPLDGNGGHSNHAGFSHFTPMWWNVFAKTLKNDSSKVFILPFGATKANEDDGCLLPHVSLDGSSFVPHAFQLADTTCGARNRTRLFLLGQMSNRHHGSGGGNEPESYDRDGCNYHPGDFVVKLFEYIEGGQSTVGTGRGDEPAMEKGLQGSRTSTPNSSYDELAPIQFQFQSGDGRARGNGANSNVWLPTGTFKLARSHDEVPRWPTGIDFCPEENVLFWREGSSQHAVGEDRLWCAPLGFSVQRQPQRPPGGGTEGVTDEVSIGCAVVLNGPERAGEPEEATEMQFDRCLLANNGLFLLNARSTIKFVSLEYGQLSKFRSEFPLSVGDGEGQGKGRAYEKDRVLTAVHKQTKELFIFSPYRKEVHFFTMDASRKSLRKKKVCSVDISDVRASRLTAFGASEMLLFFVEEIPARSDSSNAEGGGGSAHASSTIASKKGTEGTNEGTCDDVNVERSVSIYFLDGTPCGDEVSIDSTAKGGGNAHAAAFTTAGRVCRSHSKPRFWDESAVLWFLPHQQVVNAATVMTVFCCGAPVAGVAGSRTMVKLPTPSFKDQIARLGYGPRKVMSTTTESPSRTLELDPPATVVGNRVVSNPSVCHALHWSAGGLVDVHTVKHLLAICLAEKQFEDLAVLLEHVDVAHGRHHHHRHHHQSPSSASPYTESPTTNGDGYGGTGNDNSSASSSISRSVQVLQHFSNLLDIVKSFHHNGIATVPSPTHNSNPTDVLDEVSSADIRLFLRSTTKHSNPFSDIAVSGTDTGTSNLTTEAGTPGGSPPYRNEREHEQQQRGEEDPSVPQYHSPQFRLFFDELAALRRLMPAANFNYFSPACKDILSLLLLQLTSFFDNAGKHAVSDRSAHNGGSDMRLLQGLQSDVESESRSSSFFNAMPHAVGDRPTGKNILTFLETITGVDALRACFHKGEDERLRRRHAEDAKRRKNSNDDIEAFGILLDVNSFSEEALKVGDVHLDHILFVPSLDFQVPLNSDAVPTNSARMTTDGYELGGGNDEGVAGNAYFQCLCALYYRFDPSFLPTFVATLEARRRQHLPLSSAGTPEKSYFDQAVEVVGLARRQSGLDASELLGKQRGRAYSNLLEGAGRYCLALDALLAMALDSEALQTFHKWVHPKNETKQLSQSPPAHPCALILSRVQVLGTFRHLCRAFLQPSRAADLPNVNTENGAAPATHALFPALLREVKGVLTFGEVASVLHDVITTAVSNSNMH
jgi:hypothetical protein